MKVKTMDWVVRSPICPPLPQKDELPRSLNKSKTEKEITSPEQTQMADIKLLLANVPFGKLCEFLITKQLAKSPGFWKPELRKWEDEMLIFSCMLLKLAGVGTQLCGAAHLPASPASSWPLAGQPTQTYT